MSDDDFELFPRMLPYLIGSNRFRGEVMEEEEAASKLEWLHERDAGRKSYKQSYWGNYYRECFQVKIRNGDTLCLWTTHSSTNKSADHEPAGQEDLPYVLMLHGGGYSGLTWAPLIDELSWLIEAEFGALDLRGHGGSNCRDEKELSLDVLTHDVVDAIEWMQGDIIKLGRRKLVLVGHSMGGALGVNVALKLEENSSINLAGLIVLDVVEGSAMQALNSMQFFLRSRPQRFKSMTEAIQWCVRSGQTKNLDSARISIPGQLKDAAPQSATEFVNPNGDVGECDNDLASTKDQTWTKLDPGNPGNLTEVLNRDHLPPPNSDFVWRIDLSKTEPYWRGWFQGLSAKFLSVKCPKLLMLAGVDRLDRELTVGQMQGKFQMQVFHQVGHAVHEDAPDKAAQCVAAFLHRQRLVKNKTPIHPSLPGC